MRSLLVILSLAATACTVFGSPADDKAKAKAKAKAAIAIESARQSVRAVGEAMPMNDLDKAKLTAIEKGKPLVLWVGKPAEELVKEVDAVHVAVKEYTPIPTAKVVVFACENGECDQKQYIVATPSVDQLKEMVEKSKPAPSQPKKTAGNVTAEFFISTNGEAVPAEADADPVPVVQYRRECYIDEYGRQTCRLVPIETTSQPVPIEIKKSATVVTASAGDCPCVASTGSCPCSSAGFGSADGVTTGPIRSWWQNRPRLFNGRFRAAFASFFGR